MPKTAVAVDASVRSEEEQRPVQPAPEGTGPLLQRDYVAALAGTAWSPERLIEMLRSDFPRFSPAELAHFTRPDGETGPLNVGDTMHIHIRGAGDCGVMVSHVDDRSFTLQTLQGHPEAGRITFGAHRDAAGHLVARIRSRARIISPHHYVGYKLIGKRAQTRAWVTFLQRAAAACGGRLLGGVLLSTDEVTETNADRGETVAPASDLRSDEGMLRQ
jgi:hypothetical protein